MKPSYVTFSVDDGHPTDLTTAELLQKYELKATFYIPLRNAERCGMSGSQIQQLGRQFEIGAHTVNHVALTSSHRAHAWSEVKDGKLWLENLLGHEAGCFYYPCGKCAERRRTVWRYRASLPTQLGDRQLGPVERTGVDVQIGL